MQAGYKIIEEDGVVGTSGTPKVIHSVTVWSGATGSVVNIYDGTSTSGTLVLSLTGTANISVVFSLGGVGLVLKNGCYVDVDANIQSATVVYEEIL